MSKKMIQPLVILFCLLLASCTGSGTTTDRRQVTGGGDTNSNHQRQVARSCEWEFESKELINLVVIMGNRANTYELPAGSVVDNVFCELVGRTFEVSNLAATGNVAFVVSDGDPWRADVMGQNGRPADLSVSANNEYMLNNRIRNTINNEILPFMDSDHLRAQNEEADLLEALHVANRILRDMDSGRENHLLIIDSGITTAGHINMREFNLLKDGVAEEVVTRLKAAALLPDLTGVNISFYNIGSGAYPQQIPSGPVEAALISFWQGVLQTTGAELLQIQGRSEGGTPRTLGNGYPFVSNVAFDVIELDFSDLRSEVFTAASLGFIADEREFINERHAREVLSATAINLRPFLGSDPTHTVYIVGSQAVGPLGQTTEYALSLERANRVRELLITEFNLPESQLIAIGAGTTTLSWRNTEEFVAGVWRDELAEQNRVVAIIPATAAEIGELRRHGFIE